MVRTAGYWRRLDVGGLRTVKTARDGGKGGREGEDGWLLEEARRGRARDSEDG